MSMTEACLGTLCVRVFSLQIENTCNFHRIWSAQTQLKSMVAAREGGGGGGGSFLDSPYCSTVL